MKQKKRARVTSRIESVFFFFIISLDDETDEDEDDDVNT